MRLTKVHLQGYRRFLPPTTLAVGGQVTALIGPNEAGKSGLLEALSLFGPAHPRPFPEGHCHPKAPKPRTAFVELEYSISAAEREQLLWPYEKPPERLFMRLEANGRSEPRIDPPPTMNPVIATNVQTLLSELETVRQEQVQKEAFLARLIGLSQVMDVTSAASALQRHLHTHTLYNRLGMDLVEQLTQALTRLPKEAHPLFPRSISEYQSIFGFAQLVQSQVQRGDLNLVLDALPVPTPLLFTADARKLLNETDLKQLDDQGGMANLLIWGGLDLHQLSQWVNDKKEDDLASALDQASRHVNEQLKAVWPFAPILVELQLKEHSVRLLLRPAPGQPFERLERRSDGLRIFLALLAFLARHQRPDRPAILLIDEVELHLHVDAQRHLVQWMERQGVVGQIIYSTHSPFALPSDWTAIRTIHADPQTGTSHIQNRIWSDRKTDQREGLIRLLTQMGAGAAIFNAAQAVLVTEGVTDVVLLPRLLAEALGQRSLGMVTLPGFSETQHELIFEPQGARVAYLFDGDQAGRTYQRQVWKALARSTGGAVMDDVQAADRARVLTLGENRVLEDYLCPAFYAQAVNQYLAHYALTNQRLTAAELPATNRPKYVAQWGRQQGVDPNHLDKRSLTEALLDGWWDQDRHIDPDRRPELQAIATQVAAALHLTLPETEANSTDLT